MTESLNNSLEKEDSLDYIGGLNYLKNQVKSMGKDRKREAEQHILFYKFSLVENIHRENIEDHITIWFSFFLVSF